MPEEGQADVERPRRLPTGSDNAHPRKRQVLDDGRGVDGVQGAVEAAGKLDLQIRVGGEPLDDRATYKLATSDFLASGGDGYTVFKNGKNRAETGVDMLDAQIEACKAGKVVAPAGTRITMK